MDEAFSPGLAHIQAIIEMALECLVDYRFQLSGALLIPAIGFVLAFTLFETGELEQSMISNNHIIDAELLNTAGKPLAEFRTGFEGFADSCIEIVLPAWVPTQSYMENRFLLKQCFFWAISGTKLTTAFPQLDVYQRS